MKTDDILNRALNGAKKKQKTNGSKKIEPVREFKVAGKLVKVYNDHPIPKKSTINAAYSKIPDDTNIPLHFMTREQYLKKYVNNQERKNNTTFSQQQRQQYYKNNRDEYNNIIGRYTTEDNPYYKPAVVVFNDKSNHKNITKDNFKKLAWHEYGHEFVEDHGVELPKMQEEQFADYIGKYSANGKEFDPKRAKQRLDKMSVDIVDDKIENDEYSINKFKPGRDTEELSAAQKFGGQNLKGLKKIGSGRDRDVYALDDDKVVKVAKNPGGLQQNVGEQDIEFLDYGEQYEQGKDYVVMKRQQPLSIENKRKLRRVRESVEGLSNDEAKIELSKENNVLDEVGLGTDILNYNINPREVFADRQWGEDEQGNLVLLDGGALMDSQSLDKYRVKDYSSNDWQSRDWQNVQAQRQMYRKKGSYNPSRKEYIGYEPREDVQPPTIEQDYESVNFTFKKRTPVEDVAYEPEEEYPEVESEEFQEHMYDRQYVYEMDEYGRRKKISGDKLGNTMIAVDTLLPTAKVGTVAGIGVKRYVDSVSVEQTDEHDNPKRVPSFSVEWKNKRDSWTPKHSQ